MTQDFRERGRWLARNILPHEALLRSRLAKVYVYGLEIDDIIQETYARIVSQPSLESIRYPKQYAIQTATSIIIDHMRRSRIVTIHTSGDLESLDIASPDADPEVQLEFRQELAETTQTLADLPERTRDVVILRRVQGLSQQETADKLGISVKTVEKHMAQGIFLLMKMLGRAGKPQPRSSTFSELQHVDDDTLKSGD